MRVRAEMNLVNKGGLLAAGDVYLDEKIVIHKVKLVKTTDKESGREKCVVTMPSKKKGENWEKVVNIKNADVYQQIEQAVITQVDTLMKQNREPHHLDVSIRLYENGDTRGYATAIFNGSVEIRGIRITERDGKLRVNFPYEKWEDTYQNLAGPATQNAKKEMEEVILSQYRVEKNLKETQKTPQDKIPDDPMEALEDNPFEERSR